MTTKTLFLEIRTPHGVTEVFEPDEVTMAELGWVRSNSMGAPETMADVYERGVRDGMRAQAELVADILEVTGQRLVINAAGEIIAITVTDPISITAPEPMGHTDSGDPVHATNGTTLEPVIVPCKLHMLEIDASCAACYHWHNRDAKPAGVVTRIERPKQPGHVRHWVMAHIWKHHGANGVLEDATAAKVDAVIAYLESHLFLRGNVTVALKGDGVNGKEGAG